jgi:8-oxo-dGTP diphosphatase
MSYRAAIILIQNGKIALVERQRKGEHYFTFPGGHIEKGETPEQAAVRECLEELGLQVTIQKLAAEIWWQGQAQYYYLVESAGGEFGTGTGEEYTHPRPEKGTYNPTWIPVDKMTALPVLPRLMAKVVVDAQSQGWPEQPFIRRDEE